MGISFSSCGDFLDEEPPTFISGENYYKTAGDARTGVDGAYESLNNIYSRWWPIIDVYTDDLVTRTQGNSATNDFGTHTVTASNSLFEGYGMYTIYWTGIARANNVLAYVPDIEMDETEKNIILGEARALRAFFYYNLARAYGDLPLIVNAVTTESDFMKPRSSVDDIYNQIIIPDLKFAENNCRDGLHDGHISKWTAKLILSEVYLTRAGWRRTSQGTFVQGDQSNWALARDKAKEVIDNSPHGLNKDEVINGANVTPAYGVAWDKNNVFSKESMLEIAYVGVAGSGSWLSRECSPSSNGASYWGAGGNQPLLGEGNTGTVSVGLRFPGRPPGVGTYIPTPDLYDAFESGDERRDWSIMTRYDTSDGASYVCQPTMRKFVDIDYFLGLDGTSFQYTNANTILYRYADALLIYAEAQNEADNGPNVDAYNAVNEIRNRAGLGDLTAGLSQVDFREAVWKERRCEFNGESKRKFDLIRTNRLATETATINILWTSAQGSLAVYRNCYSAVNGSIPWPDNEWLWPIPQSEIELNAKNGWVQNKGY
ncbi:hypothetical protein AXE80_08870 [Wenyingzhuangia fucanilytica]|uniref:Carbohydrate-binding protein SusD n=2 Tax=Wenyingzhuangia fucanilytica TaxID=1790137 RepID=A0A1B1Y6H4_9FLAO|nr:hypothetical protein AXE80_08870 [Wenyingzhuangia fucanilytica]